VAAGEWARSAAEVTVGRDPDAVPRARRFVRSSLDGAGAELAADAELVVAELVTNASLHGEPPIAVRLVQLEGGIRVEVEDAGGDLPVSVRADTNAMTGRGLALVAAVAVRWGVGPGRRDGKVVWAELSEAPPPGLPLGGGGADPDISLVRSSPTASLRDEPAYPVVLPGVPTAILLAAKAEVDNVVRELTLLRRGQMSSGVELPGEMAELVEMVTVEFAQVRREMRRAAVEAIRRGDRTSDIRLQLPLSSAAAAERYMVALDEVDRHARAAHLLTLVPPRSHRVFRRWYLTTLVDQLRAWAGGETPKPPEPFAVALAAEVDGWPAGSEPPAGD
jgi:anti-sigma regulatory factor (Ser/Thr protein kinase)